MMPLRIVELELPASAAGVASSNVLTVQCEPGEWARIMDVRGSFQSDATIQNRVLLLRVTPDDSFACTMPATPVVPASTNVNTLWDEGGQSLLAASLSSPGHSNGAAPRALFRNTFNVQLTVNNIAGGDVLGAHRVRVAMGPLQEFEI